MRGAPENDRPSYVKWPWDRMESNGEGGMAVFLIVPEGEWPECSINLPSLENYDAIVRGQEQIERDLWGTSQYDDGAVRSLSCDLVACVCLGTTGGSWLNEAGYFKATRSDLTEEGQQIFDSLGLLYGRTPYLVTFLDT